MSELEGVVTSVLRENLGPLGFKFKGRSCVLIGDVIAWRVWLMRGKGGGRAFLNIDYCLEPDRLEGRFNASDVSGGFQAQTHEGLPRELWEGLLHGLDEGSYVSIERTESDFRHYCRDWLVPLIGHLSSPDAVRKWILKDWGEYTIYLVNLRRHADWLGVELPP